ncbi:serine/threonine-protein kinase [Geothrix sp. PMB-07]|uniref:serine/threonine-protein kinase n=1 Tax=Geothrix sp. PMB-07 TaxID=3068640 RepID=UPI00274048C6|nr:serine/threonine-protein kinase [Geothrix sp. PMB-07]WLT31451.1 serine/threonine-protein kinase [Geothrix sp. PMB-07]
MRTHIGKFEIVRLLGQGAMGEVYLGRDPGIGREVAIKTIRPALIGEDMGGDLRDRFAREAKAAGLLQHPNVVTVFEFGTDGDLLYLVMEYVPGEDLATLLQRGELRPSELLEILAQVCEGLAQAHKHGIIHRDIKPTNVMVQKEDGELHAKVMDFGVAKLNDGELTQTGHVVGTLAYMAPEYLRTGKSQPASDLFSVGVILHEGLSGERPFAAPSSGAMVYTIIHDEPHPLEDTTFEGVSPSVKALANRLLAKDPSSRFPTATDAARALRAAKNPTWIAPLDDATVALPGSSGSGHPMASTPRKARPEWAVWAVGLGVLALATGIGLASLRKVSTPAPPAVNTHINEVVLEEAARQMDAKPEHALKLVQEVIDATPDNQPVDPDAYALKMAIYYRMGFMELLEATAQEARDRKTSGAEMLKNAKFRAMLEKDKVHGRKLSADLRERLLKGEN